MNRKAKTVSVKTAGQMLTDRREILRERDPESERDPRTTRASLEENARWTCSIDPSHRWPASIGQRCLRLTGCPINARETRHRSWVQMSNRRPVDPDQQRELRASTNNGAGGGVAEPTDVIPEAVGGR